MKREIPQLLAFLSGLAMILAFFIPTEAFRDLQDTLTNWVSIVGSFATFLALTSLILIHGEKISRKDAGYGYSAVLLGVLFVTTLTGFFFGVQPKYQDFVMVPEAADRAALVDGAGRYAQARSTEAREQVLKELMPRLGPVLGTNRLATLAMNLEAIQTQAVANVAAKDEPIAKRKTGRYAGQYVLEVSYYNLFQWLYDFLYSPLVATMFSILAFYVASAAYRAFRARSVEGTMLLVAAFLVMIGRVSIGYVLYRKVGVPFPWIADWIMGVLNAAGQRAIMIGAALGIVSASLRMLLGLEQTYLGGD